MAERRSSPVRFFRTGAFADSGRLVDAVPGHDAHQPDADIRSGGVIVRLIAITDDYYGLNKHHIERSAVQTVQVTNRPWMNKMLVYGPF